MKKMCQKSLHSGMILPHPVESVPNSMYNNIIELGGFFYE